MFLSVELIDKENCYSTLCQTIVNHNADRVLAHVLADNGITDKVELCPGKTLLSNGSRIAISIIDDISDEFDEITEFDFSILDGHNPAVVRSAEIGKNPVKRTVRSGRSGQKWDMDRKNTARTIANNLKISVLQADQLVKRIKSAGFDWDKFPWDELQGGDLEYSELLKKISEIIGHPVYTEREKMDIINTHDWIISKYEGDPENWEKELCSSGRELMNALHEEIFGA
jgi:hypothetical protein